MSFCRVFDMEPGRRVVEFMENPDHPLSARRYIVKIAYGSKEDMNRKLKRADAEWASGAGWIGYLA